MKPKHILSQLNWRYAVKKMSGKAPGKKKTEALLESARLAPSSYGLQPYSLIVVTDKDLKEQLQKASFDQEKVSQASHILVFATVKDVDDELINRFIKLNAETRNKPESRFETLQNNISKKATKLKEAGNLAEWTKKQAYIALGSVLTTAAILGVDTCPMEGFSADMYDKILGLEELGLTSAVVCAVGKRADDDSYQFEPKVRRSSDEFFIRK